ncbi:beta-ketoacyl synthase N-terminal-like domain-containing protein [Sorangium sp. So ce269]
MSGVGARSVHVVGLGAQTSVGLTLPSTMAAIRGAICRFRAWDHLRDRRTGDALTLALLGTLGRDLPASERMRRLASGAAAQALAPWRRVAPSLSRDAARLPVVVAIPAARPGWLDPAGLRLVREILGGLPVAVDGLGSFAVAAAHTGGFGALAHACAMIRGGQAEAVLVGGVESCADIETLDWFAAQERLKSEGTPFGMIPGEAASFILLASGAFSEREGLASAAEIVAVSETVEPSPWYTRQPSTASALTEALLQVLAPPGEAPRQAVVTYADLNGEAWRAEEWNLAYVRTGRLHGHPLDLRHPADCLGDVGAATGLFLVAMAAFDFCHDDHAGTTAVAWAASDVLPHRAACFLRKPEPAREGP